MKGFLARARSLWRGMRRPDQLEAEMDEEMRFHLEMEAERLARERGLRPAEARRQARIAFGSPERYKEEGRDVRGVTWLSGLSLDLKLGWRMLARSPGLTVVGGLGMAVAVAMGIGFFVFLHSLIYPRLPLDEGDRIVALENWDVEANNEERRALHDFAAWRGEMRTVEQISAFRLTEHRLVTADALHGGVPVAEMTASAFTVARVPPLLGRYLVEDDEREGAPPVVVIGYDAWQARFGGDPAVIGKQVQLGMTAHTVVGVMPPGFAFPKSHGFWTALRADPSRHARGEGPELFVFGRLAPGATMEQAQAELTALGRRTAAAFPATHAKLRPQVLPYTYPLDDIQDMSLWQAWLMQLFISLLLVVVAVNVAVLVYARTAARRGEIAVRTALGASRGRIVAQLFAEALVLSSGAAAAGLLLAHLVLGQVKGFMDRMDGAGFWMDFRVRPATLLYAVGLALLAAGIVGVVPALQSTGRRLNADLRGLGGGTGMRLGATWSLLIVAQVAIAVAAVPTAVNLGWDQLRHMATRPSFPVEEFLVAGVGMAMDLPPGADAEAYQRETQARFGLRLAELARRLETGPEVAGVTFRASLPGRWQTVEVEGVSMPPDSPEGHYVTPMGVDTGFFAVFGARTLEGRRFGPGDLGRAGTAVVVTRGFVHQVLGGADAVGRRIRHLESAEGAQRGEVKPGPWYEIVGIVEDLSSNPLDPRLTTAGVYYPVSPGEVQGATLLVRLRGAAYVQGFTPKLRAAVAAVDPALRVGSVRSLDADQGMQRMLVLGGLVLLLVLSAVLLLSAAGIHALMSFTVTQRRKEIAIRTALGAHPRRLLRSIFARALGQLAVGGGVGCLLGGALLLQGGSPAGRTAVLLATAAALMLGAGLLAAIGPARRGLRIQPMEALKAE